MPSSVVSIPPRPPVVLVVEDDLVNQNLLAEVCRSEGFVVLRAADGEEALRACRENVVDLVLLDLSLPKLDGFQVCRTLRASSDTPIIIISASPEEQARGPSLEAGAFAFIAKPFRLHELARQMRVALTDSRFPSEPPSSVSQQRRRNHAVFLERIEGPMHFRPRFRRDAQHGSGAKSLVLARLCNEAAVVAAQGRMARDAFLGLLVEQFLLLESARHVFWTDSGEIAVLSVPDCARALIQKGLDVIPSAESVGLRELDLRFGCVHYPVAPKVDIDIILQEARTMCDDALRRGQRWGVSTLVAEHLITSSA